MNGYLYGANAKQISKGNRAGLTGQTRNTAFTLRGIDLQVTNTSVASRKDAAFSAKLTKKEAAAVNRRELWENCP